MEYGVSGLKCPAIEIIMSDWWNVHQCKVENAMCVGVGVRERERHLMMSLYLL